MVVIFSFYYNFHMNGRAGFDLFCELILIGNYSFFAFLPFYLNFIATVLKKIFMPPLMTWVTTPSCRQPQW